MQRVVFLDRDGTINVDDGYVYRAEDWAFCDGAAEGVRLLKSEGFAVAVVTNQSGIARGLYTAQDVERLHRFAERELSAQGAAIDAIAFCPHGADDGCRCRKPATGMADQVAESLGAAIDYAGSWMIGDKVTDIEFGFRLGARTALLTSRYWTPSDLVRPPDVLADSLWEAARKISERTRSRPDGE